MDNNYTHYKCSITLRQSEERKFEFIVPKHSVDKEGTVDPDILEEIIEKFEDGELSFQECETDLNIPLNYSPTSTSILIESGCNYRDEYPNYVSYYNALLPPFPVFGEDE